MLDTWGLSPWLQFSKKYIVTLYKSASGSYSVLQNYPLSNLPTTVLRLDTQILSKPSPATHMTPIISICSHHFYMLSSFQHAPIISTCSHHFTTITINHTHYNEEPSIFRKSLNMCIQGSDKSWRSFRCECRGEATAWTSFRASRRWHRLDSLPCQLLKSRRRSHRWGLGTPHQGMALQGGGRWWSPWILDPRWGTVHLLMCCKVLY